MSASCWRWGAIGGIVIALSGGCGEGLATRTRQERAGEADHADHQGHEEEEHDEHEHDGHDHDEHEHDEHDHAHLDPVHRPPHFVAAVQRLEDLSDALERQMIPSSAQGVTWVKEAEDLWRWLPELAAATDLSESDWNRIQEASNAIHLQWKGRDPEALPDAKICNLWRANIEVLKGLADSIAEATRQEELAFRLASDRAQEARSELAIPERTAGSSEEQQ